MPWAGLPPRCGENSATVSVQSCRRMGGISFLDVAPSAHHSCPTWNTNRPTVHELERCPSSEHSRYSSAPSLGCQGSSDHRLGRGLQMVVELPEL